MKRESQIELILHVVNLYSWFVNKVSVRRGKWVLYLARFSLKNDFHTQYVTIETNNVNFYFGRCIQLAKQSKKENKLQYENGLVLIVNDS